MSYIAKLELEYHQISQLGIRHTLYQQFESELLKQVSRQHKLITKDKIIY